MPSLFDPAARQAIEARIGRLRPDSQRHWGKMTAAEMQVHIADGIRLALGTKVCAPKPGPFRNALVRWIVIDSPLPWPKGAPTAPELLNPPTATWDADRQALLDTIQAVVARGEGADFHEHPAFGKLDGRQWGVLMWRHVDHHLRQFSV